MSEFKGKLHETTVKFPMTDIWMDSCGLDELKYGIERGCTSATSNPLIVASVVRQEMDYWLPYIKQLVKDNPSYTEDEITWALIDEVGRQRSPMLLPIFEKYNGKKGRLSIQTNAKYYRDTEKIVEQGLHLNSLGKNMQVKAPASAAGIKAMEELTYRGVSINATVSFTVAQAVAVAEAVERGLARRKKEGLDCSTMSPVCTIMAGRVDDWVKTWVNNNGLIVDPECLEWGGVAVVKEAYRIYRERGYVTHLLTAANRNHYHWSEFIGGDLMQTINIGWQKRLEKCDVEVVERMSHPVPAKWLEDLMKLPEFVKAFDEKGQTPEEFEEYGAFKFTLKSFISGYDQFVAVIRDIMVG